MISERLRAQYIQRRGEDLQTCKGALEQGDYETIRKVAHRLKGNGTTFGYPEITELGERMEDAARATNLAETRASLETLAKWIEAHGSAGVSG